MHGIVLTYPKEECIIRKYQDEIKYITQHSKRNNLIKNLKTLDQKGNTLILFSLIKHGELLYNMIKEKTNDVHLVYGSSQIQKQEREYEDLRKSLREEFLSPVSVYSVLASILGIFITSFLLVLISLVLGIYNQ